MNRLYCCAVLLCILMLGGWASADPAPSGTASAAPSISNSVPPAQDNGVDPTGFGIGLGVWMNPSFSGLVSRSGGNIINFASALGFGNQTVYVPEISYRFKHGQILSANYNSYQETTQTVAPTNLNYSTVGFPAGTNITSTLQMQWSDISYELPIYYDTYPPHNQFLNAVISVKVMRGTFQMVRYDGAVAAHEPITEPAPMFGLHGEFRLGPSTSAHFRITGIYGSLQGASGSSEDIQAGFTQKLFGDISAAADYRYWNFYQVINHGTLNLFAFRLFGPQLTVQGKF